MLEWTNNPWVVGVGGGILSGLLVTFISRKLLSRKDRGEYDQKVQSANREIIYALRPDISEGQIPEQSVVEALINATARKYTVDRSDLYNSTQVGEELIKEIMDSSFISANTKKEYCSLIHTLTHKPDKRTDEIEESGDMKSRSDLAEYRSRMVRMNSIMLGVMTAMMTMVLVFSGIIEKDIYSEITYPLLPLFVAFIAVLMAAILSLLRSGSKTPTGKKDESEGKTKNHSKPKDSDKIG